eukprot:5883940-Pleurochrysis_carterae.AAC.4
MPSHTGAAPPLAIIYSQRCEFLAWDMKKHLQYTCSVPSLLLICGAEIMDKSLAAWDSEAGYLRCYGRLAD